MAVTPVLRLPFIGTFLALGRTPYLRATLPLAALANRRLLNVELHGIDLIDASDPVPRELVPHQPDLPVSLERKLALYEEMLAWLAARRMFVPLAEAVALL